MRRKPARTVLSNCRQLAPALLVLLGLSSCSLFKKAEPGPDAQGSAAPAAGSVSAARLASARMGNPECVKACRQSYRDCASRIGDASRVEGIGKCREVLRPCLATCNPAP